MKSVYKLILSITSFALAFILVLSGSLFIAFQEAASGENLQNGSASTDDKIPSANQNDLIVSQEGFADPDRKYRGLQIVHDYAILPGQTYADKINSITDSGFGGFVTNDSWVRDYLKNDRRLERLNEFVHAARDLGVRVWLYDEKGYPSGSAGDLVVEDDGKYQAINLGQVVKAGSGTDKVTVNVPDGFISVHSASIFANGKYTAVNAVSDGKTISFNGVEGNWEAYVYCVMKYDHTENPYSDTYPNLLNRDAVKKFIEVTYEKYAGAIEDFGDIVEAFFDDEPQLAATRNQHNDFKCAVIPYDFDIFETFEAKFGYDLVPHLPVMFNSLTEDGMRMRAQFYSHVGDLLSENFVGQIQEWCKAHGTEFSGHLLLEEEIKYHIPVYGDYIKVSAEMGYPGFDILNPRPDQYMAGISTGGKYASSIAWLQGKERVFIEICPVHDPDEYATNHLDYAIGTMTFAYFDGGNQLASYYGQSHNNPEVGKPFNEYIGRLGSLLVGAQNKTDIAVYYAIDAVSAYYTTPTSQSVYKPNELAKVNDALISAITKKLRANGHDYVFLDGESMRGGTVTDNSLKVGAFDFKTIIVPRATLMNYKDVEVLEKLIEKGVNVIFVGAMPSVALMEADQAKIKTFAQKNEDKLVLDENGVIEKIKTRIPLGIESKQTIFASPYEKDGIEFYYLANASKTDATVKFTYENATGFRIYDPVTGEIKTVDSSYTINAYRGLFVQPLLDK